MEKILAYFVDFFINSAKKFGVNMKTCECKAKDLTKDSYRVFEIPYFGHASGFFRLAVEHGLFEKYVMAFDEAGDIKKASSLFHELLNQSIGSTIANFDDFEHCTVGLPRSFNSPIYETLVKTVEQSLYDESCDSYLSLFIHHDARKTDLSVVYENQKNETIKVSLLAEQLENEKVSMNAQKFEAIGQMAAGVAHEINTPIQFVSDNINFLTDSFDKFLLNIDNVSQLDLDYYKEEIPAALAESKEGIGRIANIVKSLKEFSHPGNDQVQLYPIKKLVENCVSLTRNEWKYAAEITTDVDDLKVQVFPNELSQVLVNMIVNSAHSIQEKFEGKKEGLIDIKFYKEEDLYVFMIEDNGKGIEQKYIDKVFNPFFTTKQIGKGTGQGLAISKKIIEEKHGGKIDIVKNSQDGLCFKLSIREKVQ